MKNKTIKRKRSKAELNEIIQGYTFMAPALLVILVFIILSILYAIYLSFNNVNLIAQTNTWNNFSNYKNLLTDGILLRAFQNTGFFCPHCCSSSDNYCIDHGLYIG